MTKWVNPIVPSNEVGKKVIIEILVKFASEDIKTLVRQLESTFFFSRKSNCVDIFRRQELEFIR